MHASPTTSPAAERTAGTIVAGRVARAVLAVVLVAVATVTILGMGAAPAQATTVAPARAAWCTPAVTPVVSGLEVAGPKVPTGGSELGASVGSPSIRGMRKAGFVPVGPRGYHAVLAAFVHRALTAEPGGC